MNDIYDNNMKFLPLLKFLDKNKKIIFSLLFIAVTVSVYFVVSNQISKQNNNNAAKIYKDFLIEIELENKNIQKIGNYVENLLKNYPKTGYAKVALLKKASLDANNKNFESALENYHELILITDGFNGNKTFNKLARVNSARIHLANGEHDSALKMIEKYSSTSTNAFIHELTGDILVEKNKTQLALLQYEKASEKYTDDSSKLIISMKIANLGI